ncbi:hypothetical protein PAERUG_E16_London_17_VIM_2_04_14_02801 [Pseudomonas aeruginosa]|nr:hypothetical protein PAERUG_E16_London_17_VIM_2_04_14_02801 [Pseudomonas aeruginosa]
MALAVDLHAQRALRLVDQEREQADHRIHRRPAADDAGQAGRHPGGGLGDLAGEQHQGFLARMPDGQLDHHFAAVLPSPMGTIGGFAAEQFDIDLAVGLPAALGEDFLGPGDDRLADPLGLLQRIDAGDQATGGAAETVRIGGADLVPVGGRQAARAFHRDPVGSDLAQAHLGEVADHVGQQVGAWVADLVEHLFADAQFADQATGAGRLGHHEAPVGLDLDDGETDVLVVRHLLPVGEIAACALRAAFDDVPGEGGLGQSVVVVPGPAELVHQGGADHRAVDHPAGDHDIRAQAQGLDDARRAEVGVERDAHRRERRVAEHLADAGLGQFGLARLQVVAMEHGDLQLHPGLLAGRGEGGGTGLRIDPASVADDADLLLGDLAQQWCEDLDEVGGVAGVRLFQAGPGHDRHGDLGQVVEHQVVQRRAAHQLGGRGAGVAPEGRGAADAYGLLHCS